MFENAGSETAKKIKNIIGLDEALKNWIRNTFHTLNDKLPGSLDSLNNFLDTIVKNNSVEKISQLIIEFNKYLKTPIVCISIFLGVVGIIGTVVGITSYFQNKRSLKIQEESLKIQQQLLKIQEQLLKIQNS